MAGLGEQTVTTRNADYWLDALRGLGIDEPVRIMNVCGGHERSISVAGLRTAIPETIELVPGPGCPVCICPEEDVFEAIQLARNEDIILVAFGDMLRVPVNAPKRDPRSLEQARAAGADIRPIASPSDAVRIARDNPSRSVVFFAAGFSGHGFKFVPAIGRALANLAAEGETELPIEFLGLDRFGNISQQDHRS